MHQQCRLPKTPRRHPRPADNGVPPHHYSGEHKFATDKHFCLSKPRKLVHVVLGHVLLKLLVGILVMINLRAAKVQFLPENLEGDRKTPPLPVLEQTISCLTA